MNVKCKRECCKKFDTHRDLIKGNTVFPIYNERRRQCSQILLPD